MRKILFLDIDWVLNNDVWDISKERKMITRNKGFPYKDLDPQCIKRLIEIVNKTNCEIWLSSTWRTLGPKQFRNRFLNCYDLFENYIGVKLSGVTPNIPNKSRGHEIEEIILKEKPDIYAIVDDIDDMLDSQKENFVQTTAKYGLDDKVKNKLIDILNDNRRVVSW